MHNVVNCCCTDDHSRVVLQDAGDDASDYINANYIDVSPLFILYHNHCNGITFTHCAVCHSRIIVKLLIFAAPLCDKAICMLNSRCLRLNKIYSQAWIWNFARNNVGACATGLHEAGGFHCNSRSVILCDVVDLHCDNTHGKTALLPTQSLMAIFWWTCVSQLPSRFFFCICSGVVASAILSSANFKSANFFLPVN